MTPVRPVGVEQIGSAEQLRGTTEIQRPEQTHEINAVSFGSVLEDMVGQASEAQRSAAQKAEALAAGSSDDIHGTMIAVKEAEISMKLVGTVKNKLIDAFHELWRTSV